MAQKQNPNQIFSGLAALNMPAYRNLTRGFNYSSVYIPPMGNISPNAPESRGPASSWRDAVWGRSTTPEPSEEETSADKLLP